MNTIYIKKFCNTSMIKLINTSVVTHDEPNLKLALSKGGSRGNTKLAASMT